MNYHCCRKGAYKPKGKGVKKVVQYFPNHENQLEHLRLSESYRAAVAGRLKEGVSEKKILQDIREEITVDRGRKMLIEKKDIHNIKRDFNINGYIKRHEVDAVSVKLWTQEIKIMEKIVLFFSKSRDNQGMTID
ncbi:MULE domain-containing protein [Trichonephila clavata]|uniref:MULE domain-containing protein n=1 Tax=Trichonephila clavata TaxID=2740835 RepID=A0A8X6FYL6_TRICU|nr:MULE domain-containing protein [Trichonephila clavata]